MKRLSVLLVLSVIGIQPAEAQNRWWALKANEGDSLFVDTLSMSHDSIGDVTV